jgi:hypothetical protein
LKIKNIIPEPQNYINEGLNSRMDYIEVLISELEYQSALFMKNMPKKRKVLEERLRESGKTPGILMS